MTMLERCADRAKGLIIRKTGFIIDEETATRVVRAVLTELRTPDEAMECAADRALAQLPAEKRSLHYTTMDERSTHWQAMITQVLDDDDKSD